VLQLATLFCFNFNVLLLLLHAGYCCGIVSHPSLAAAVGCAQVEKMARHFGIVSSLNMLLLLLVAALALSPPSPAPAAAAAGSCCYI
jgi:hypothetical protein